MFARLSRSWALAKASAAVLRADKELLLFPLCSGASLLVLTLAFLLPAVGLGALDALFDDAGNVHPAGYALAFLFYFSQYFIIFFFNSALVGSAMLRLGGATPTFRDGIRLASRRIGAIAGYALIATTVGILLRMLQERVGFIGRIVVALVGVAWNIATFLVVPVLVADDGGPLEAVKHSARLVKKTWGENIIGNAGIGLAFGLLSFGFVILGIAALVMAIVAKSITLVVLVVALTIVGLVLLFLVHSALTGIYAAALYRFALGKPSQGFEGTVLQAAFAPKP